MDNDKAGCVTILRVVEKWTLASSSRKLDNFSGQTYNSDIVTIKWISLQT